MAEGRNTKEGPIFFVPFSLWYVLIQKLQGIYRLGKKQQLGAFINLLVLENHI